MSKVSVIIPVYNGEEYIAQTISSVVEQSYNNIQIIIVDDGSIDKTIEICKEIRKRDKRIEVFAKQNGGVSSARNFGIKKASGDYLFFLDADDYIDKDLIKNLMANLSCKKTELCGCKVRVEHARGGEVLNRKRVYTRDNFYKAVLKDEIQGFSCGYLFDAKICKKILFDTRLSYCEDLVFVAEYIESAGIQSIEFMNEKEGVLHYVQHNDSATLSASRLEKNALSMQLALQKFNLLTKNKYQKLVDNKMVMLYESEFQKINSLRDFTVVANKYPLRGYDGGGIRYKLFFFLYSHKMSVALFIYYKLRGVAKFIKRGLA